MFPGILFTLPLFLTELNFDLLFSHPIFECRKISVALLRTFVVTYGTELCSEHKSLSQAIKLTLRNSW
jgi:hypothetical protein